MIRNLRRLTAVLSVFAYSLLSAQGTCNYSDNSSGLDNSAFVEFNSFDCVDTVTNSFITEAVIDFTGATSTWACTSWYSYDLVVNGSVVAEDLCNIVSTDLTEYGVDINNLTSVKIVGVDEDGWNDNVTMSSTLDLTYIITTCPPPSGVEISNINPTTADVTWSSNGSETLWNIEVVNLTAGDTATGVATYSGVTVNPYVVTSLLPENEYEVYVQADCGVFNTTPLSNWSSAGNFITPPTCLPLGAISIDSISDTSVYLSWAQAGSETSWDIELINTSNIPADTFTFVPNNAGLGTNAPILTSLVPESDYEFIVRANCGIIDGPGAWTTVYSFTTLPTCQAPIDLVLGAFTNNEITFSWTSIDTETLWHIEYINVTLGETLSGIADDSTTSTSYTAMNLDANSEYELYVRAACGGTDGNSEWSGPVTITTLCNPVAMPFTEPFSTWVPECFDVDNGEQPWSAYVSGGDTLAAMARNISWGNYSTNRHLITPLIDMTQDALLTFQWSHLEYTWQDDTLSVNISDDGGATWTTLWSVNGAAFNSNDGASSSSPGSYLTEYLLIDNSYVGSDVMVDIAYTSEQSYGYGVFIDSMAVTALPPCNIPYDLAVDSAGTTTVDMSFTVAGTGATLYEIEIIELNDTLTGTATNTASGTPFQVTGLTPGTDYLAYVRTMCGTDSTAWVGPVSFTTVCAPVLDYFTSFEGLGTGDPVNCWNFIDSTSSAWSTVQLNSSQWTPGSDGIVSLRFYSQAATLGSTFHQYAVLPEFSNVSAGTHRLRFFGRQNTNDGQSVAVGTMSDNTDISTFTPMDTVAMTNVYEQYTFNFDEYTGTDTYVAVRNIAGSTYSYTYLDEFLWEEMPDCFPAIVTVDSTTTTSVSISIDSTGTFGTEWFIVMEDVTGANPTVLDTATTLSHTITGLMPSTVYTMTISTSCANAVSEAAIQNVQTDCAPIGDFFNGFEDLDAGADTTICWDYTVVHNSTSAWSFPAITTYNSTWSFCEGSKAVRMYSGDDLGAELLLVTPELTDITAGTHVLTFAATTFSNWAPASPFEVGTITDGNDPSTFTSMYSGSVSGSSCDSIIVPFLSYTGTDTRIAIKFNATSTYDNLYIDKVRWEEGPDCALPVGLNVNDLTDTEVTLDWLNISPDSVWYLELVDVLDTLDVYDSIPTDTALSHPYTITGLTENTIYDVYLSNLCDTVYADVSLTFVTPWGNNLGVTSIISPVTAGCNLSDSLQIEVEIENFGGQMATGFPVELSWDDSIYFNVGTFMDTLQPGQSATFVIDGYYDFSSANDSAFWVQTALAADSVTANDGMGSSVTNLGNMFINVQINTGNYGGEVHWAIWDTVNNILADTVTPGSYFSNGTFNREVCVYEGEDYIMNAWDTYDDGWNGGTYSITRCGGIILANNDGNEVTNGTGGVPWPNYDLEVQEGFHVTPCPDDDLAVLSIDGYSSACGLGSEIGSVKLINFGNNDVAANGATAQYQFNNSGLWIDFWDFSEGLASQADTVLDIPAINMSIGGIYTIAVKIVFALDQDLTSNELSIDVTSVPTLTEDSSAFEMDNGFWRSEVYGGVNNSWEHGTPTTSNIGNNNDGKVWALNLTGDAALNEQTYLYSPCYDISGYTEALEVSFDYVRTGFSHSIRLQRSFDGGTSWYTWPTWGANGFPQSNTNDWTPKAIMLPNSVTETEVIFRWRYTSSWLNPIEGFGFDNWEVKEHVPYTDATLSDLEVAGNTVTDPVTFDPAVLDYNYQVPFGSTNYNVTASSIAPFYTSITIDQVSSLPDTAFVTIIAEDTLFSTTYSVYITEEPAATDATLTSLSVSNSSVPGFNSDTLCYTITYPFGSTFMPSVVAVANDPNATVVINNVNVPGTATIVVTAEDGVTVTTYCINYEVETLSTNAFLSDILLDAVSITGFAANTYTYFVELPNGTTSIPMVTYTTADANAMINYTPATLPLTDTATIEVTAQDGITMLTYYVIFTEAPSSNANLLDLTINGGTVTGFASGTLVYDVEIPYNSPIPNLGALAEDTTANIVVDNAIVVPGTTIITVTAEDGTVLTYYINWTYAAASNVATLDSLMTDAGLFCIIASPDTLAQMSVSPVDENAYTLTVSTGSNVLVTLTAIPTDGNATVVITGTATMAPYGELIITVTAEDNSTIEVYTVQVISENCSIGLDETVLEQISVSPNPSNGIFFIETPADLNNYTIAVVDQLGKMVYEEAVIDASMEKVIDLSTLPAGMYNLRINTANESIVKRISIIK